jgi:Fe-S cluster biogenesis protein NfuA
MKNPAEEADFRGRVQKLEGLLREIEAYADPAMRGTALEAVQTLMEFHGAAVAGMIEHVATAGEAGREIITRFGNDDLVSSLLLLYGLHPADFDTRVRQALDKARGAVKSNGGTLELLSVNDGVVRVRVERSGHGCGSTAGKIKAAIEDAVYERAPEVMGIEIEGLAPPAASAGFVPLEQLRSHKNGRAVLSGADNARSD